MKSRQVSQQACELFGRWSRSSCAISGCDAGRDAGRDAGWSAARGWMLAALSLCAYGTATALAAIPPSERPRLDEASAPSAAARQSHTVLLAGPSPKIFGDDDEAATSNSAAPRDGLLAPVLDWLQRTTGDYHAIVVRQLSDQPAGLGDEPVDVSQVQPGATPGGGVVPPVRREKPAAPSSQPMPAPDPAAAPAAKPAEPKSQAQPPTADTSPAVEKSSPSQQSGGVFGTIQDWLARANREYQGVVVKQLSLPPAGPAPGGVADDAIAKKIEETKGDDAAQSSAEAKRREDDRRRAAETKRLADDARKTADKILKAEPAQKPEPVKPSAPPPEQAADVAREALGAAEKKLADEKLAEQKLAEQKQADELRRIEQQKRAEEARRQQDEQRKLEARIAEQRRIAEDAARVRNTSRTIVITPEPIPRPDAAATVFRPKLFQRPATRTARVAEADRENVRDEADDDTRARRITFYPERRAHRGTVVKRWVWRSGGGRSCWAAGRRIVPPARYTVQRGDSLWRISARHYNHGRRYLRIYRANRSTIADPDLIYPCQRVLVPKPGGPRRR